MPQIPMSLTQLGWWDRMEYRTGEQVCHFSPLGTWEWLDTMNKTQGKRLDTLENLKKEFPYHCYGKLYSKRKQDWHGKKKDPK
jgi:hypothetical protein